MEFCCCQLAETSLQNTPVHMVQREGKCVKNALSLQFVSLQVGVRLVRGEGATLVNAPCTRCADEKLYRYFILAPRLFMPLTRCERPYRCLLMPQFESCTCKRVSLQSARLQLLAQICSNKSAVCNQQVHKAGSIFKRVS